MKTLALSLLLSTSAIAANSFPPCNGSFVNEVWKAQDGSYWYCDGANWNSVASGIAIDGGYVDLSNAQTAGGNKSWTADAGFRGNVTIGGFVSIGSDAGVAGKFYTNGDFNLGQGCVIDNGGAMSLNCSTTMGNNVTITTGANGRLNMGNGFGITMNGDPINGADAGFNAVSVADGGFQKVAASVDVEVAGQLVPTQHGATQLAIEQGADAGTTGVLTVAFSTAFTAAPLCFCSHVDTTNTNTCTIDHTTVPTTALAKFNVASGGTDKIYWMCVGTK